MTLKKQYIQVADKKDYFLSCNFKWESQARQSLRLRTFLFGSVTGCEKSTTAMCPFLFRGERIAINLNCSMRCNRYAMVSGTIAGTRKTTPGISTAPGLCLTAFASRLSTH